MSWLARDLDTICAVSTAPGFGGIAVIRVSGVRAVEFTRRLCSFLPETIESHRVYYGFLRDGSTEHLIDEVLVTYFAKGRSFTGEETIEISCHGSPSIATQICQELIAVGCRAASPGEYTYRAFVNGRVDLVQAESVLALVESQSRQASKMALRQLQGELSQVFSSLEEGLIWCLAQLEASIDFSAENLDVVDFPALQRKVREGLAQMDQLLSSYRVGRVLRDGFRVAIVGEPNVGKSSLLNALSGQERSIVTATPGTTRDLVEGHLVLDGIALDLIDTAGLRETHDPIEKIGIERARQAATEADLILHVVDSASQVPLAEFEAAGLRVVLVANKKDLLSEADRLECEARLRQWGERSPVFLVSSKTGEGLTAIREYLREVCRPVDHEQSAVITQARQFELVAKASGSATRAVSLLLEGASPDLVALELQGALLAIQEALGKQFDDEVLDRIFKEFCIGK